MTNVEEKLAKSLTADSTLLIPHLPYLLQDLWELGASPEDILKIIEKHVPVSSDMQILDLACGKGAVSVRLAKALGCRVKGIDIIPEFIEYAGIKATEYGVDKLCTFEVGDINRAVLTEKGYDVVIFGAVGDVLGAPEEALLKLKGTAKSGGYILIDDAYGDSGCEDGYATREQWLSYISGAGMVLLEDKLAAEEEIKSTNNEQLGVITKRAGELKKLYPDKARLFDDYVKNQQEECSQLENDIQGVTMLIKT